MSFLPWKWADFAEALAGAAFFDGKGKAVNKVTKTYYGGEHLSIGDVRGWFKETDYQMPPADQDIKFVDQFEKLCGSEYEPQINRMLTVK